MPQEDPLKALAKKYGVGAQDASQDPLAAVGAKHGVTPQAPEGDGSTPPTATDEDIRSAIDRAKFKSDPGDLGASLAGAARSIPFSDEIFAGVAAFGGHPYEKTRAAANRVLDKATEGHERAAFLGEMGGSMLIPLGAAKTAKTFLGKLGRGAAAGGVQGGLQGAGLAEGGVAERLEGGVEGAAWGAGAGTVMAGALPIAKKVGNVVMDAIPNLRPKALPDGVELRYTAPASPGMVATDRDRAADKILEAIDGRASVDDIRGEVARRSQNPKPEVLEEVLSGVNREAAERVGSLTETVATIRPELVEGPLTDRIGQPLGKVQPSLRRIRADIERAYGLTAGSTTEAVDDILTKRSQAASPLYDTAFKAGAVTDPRLPELLKRESVKDAVGYARRLANEAGETLNLPDAGAPIDIRTLHHIKLALDDQIAASKLDTSKGPTLRARIVQTRDAIREILHTNDAYREGAEIWAGDSRLKEMVEDGHEVATAPKARASEIRKALNGAVESERVMFRQGVVNGLVERTGDVGDARDIALKIAGNDNLREALEATFKDPKDFSQWLDDLQREHGMVNTRNKRLRGSQTARRLFGQEELTDLPANASPRMLSPSFWAERTIAGARRQQMKGLAESLGPMLTAGTDGAAMSMDDLLRLMAERQAARGLSAQRQATVAGATGRITGGRQSRDR